jgi:hypothetical protein
MASISTIVQLSAQSPLGLQPLCLAAGTMPAGTAFLAQGTGDGVAGPLERQPFDGLGCFVFHRREPEAACREALAHLHLRAVTLGRDVADGVGGLAQRTQGVGACLRMFRIDHHHHADAVVEGAVHLDVVDASGGLQPGKEFGLWPTAFLQMRGQACRQHAGDVFQQATAGDVCQGLDRVGSQRSQHVFHVQARGHHQGLFEGLAIEHGGRLAARALDAFAHQ